MGGGRREKYLKSGRTFQFNVFQLDLFFIQGDQVCLWVERMSSKILF